MFKKTDFKIHKGNIDMIGYLGAESGCGLHTFLASLNDLNIDFHYCLEFFLDSYYNLIVAVRNRHYLTAHFRGKSNKKNRGLFEWSVSVLYVHLLIKILGLKKCIQSPILFISSSHFLFHL